ncbi:sensor histidine kinase [Occultella glacieicola]|uniref:histidine kinase n=1 Tax=Occultella glacieicola TaxID=2518684 RepID=A0ABY2E3M2_9MICO|nr:sensor histidine kinase [Occultella glacieicola]TDE92716.1 sensor histidine kinase [Occultella glacieicola]
MTWAWDEHTRERRRRRAAVFGPVALAIVQLFGTFGAWHNQPDSRPPGPLGILLLLAGPLALLGARWRPRTVLVAVLAITLTYLALGFPYGPVVLSPAVAAIITVVRGHRTFAWLAAGATLLGIQVIRVTLREETFTWFGTTATVAWALIVLGIGELIRLNRARQAEFRRARAEAERRRVSEDQLRVARELHDVVAHHMSLINVQAGVALHLVDRRPEQVELALTTIKDASKEALTELRALIGVLRAEGEGAPRAPAADLGGLAPLISRASQAGVSTTLEVVGDLDDVPAAVGTAGFRIVQEAITNVVRHSGATRARARVRITVTDSALEVAVTDNGRGPGPAPVPGNGLRGMAERATAVGGSVRLTDGPDGGAALVAQLPWRTNS